MFYYNSDFALVVYRRNISSLLVRVQSNKIFYRLPQSIKHRAKVRIIDIFLHQKTTRQRSCIKLLHIGKATLRKVF